MLRAFAVLTAVWTFTVGLPFLLSGIPMPSIIIWIIIGSYALFGIMGILSKYF